MEQNNKDGDVELEANGLEYDDETGDEEEAARKEVDEAQGMEVDPEPETVLANDSDQEEDNQGSDEPSTQNSDECKHDRFGMKLISKEG